MSQSTRSFNIFEQTLNLSPKRSKQAVYSVSAAYSLAACSVLITPVLLWIKFLLLCVVVGLFFYAYHRLKKLPKLKLSADNEWSICSPAGQWSSVTLEPSTRCFAGLVLLVLRHSNGTVYRFFLMPDSLPKTTFRRLKVRLNTWQLFHS